MRCRGEMKGPRRPNLREGHRPRSREFAIVCYENAAMMPSGRRQRGSQASRLSRMKGFSFGVCQYGERGSVRDAQLPINMV